MEGAEVDTQSCMDQSILAIFENSTVPSEVRTKAGHQLFRRRSIIDENNKDYRL